MANLAERPYLRQLEKLSQSFLRGKFEGAETLWQFQLDLLELQRDIQRAIVEAKRKPRRDAAERAQLESLRRALWHAPRFGDAFAWALLNGDRQYIYPLGHNDQPPVSEEGHGSRGLVAAAAAMSNDGMGFPLLHDTTHMLRIGDLSLIKPGEPPRAVEVKTTVVRETMEGDERTIEYSVRGYGAVDAAQQGATPMARRPRTRFGRQLERLDRAQARASMEPGLNTEPGGSRVLTSFRTGGEASPARWRGIRAAIREARSTGYGHQVIDRASTCAALYSADGWPEAAVEERLQRLPSDIAQSGIFLEDRSRNSLVISAVPHPEPGTIQQFLPYFLYPIPLRAVFDMLHGRLVLISLVNPGRIAEALELEGFAARLPSSQADHGRDPIVVSTTLVGADGNEYHVDLHQLRLHLDEMAMEFLPAAHLLDVARAMRSALADALVPSSEAS